MVAGDLVTDKRESDYRYRAAREAFRWKGARYADCIEEHTAELVAKGYDVADRSLGEALAGNDGD